MIDSSLSIRQFLHFVRIRIFSCAAWHKKTHPDSPLPPHVLHDMHREKAVLRMCPENQKHTRTDVSEKQYYSCMEYVPVILPGHGRRHNPKNIASFSSFFASVSLDFFKKVPGIFRYRISPVTAV